MAAVWAKRLGRVKTRSAVVATGTFLRGLIHIGDEKTRGGRHGEPPADALSASLEELGFEIRRLKTGTPPRVDGWAAIRS